MGEGGIHIIGPKVGIVRETHILAHAKPLEVI